MADKGRSLFGFAFTRKSEQKELPSFVPRQEDEGAILLSAGGAYGQYVDIEGTAKNEAELITRYRELAKEAEVEYAIDEIINEAVASDENDVVEINTDGLEGYSETIKKKLRDEFNEIKELLDINNISYEMFRRWYIDGRIYYHVLIDESKPTEGIQELRYIDPRKLKKVRELVKDPHPSSTANTMPTKFTKNEYYIYSENGFTSKNDTGTAQGNYDVKAIKIAKDSIIYSTSGLMDENNKFTLSYLHKALRPYNQLRSLENSLIIYRLVRAPERRVFYIDVGDLPPAKAEQYLRDMMVKHKNRLVYDAANGEVRDDRKHMTMLEDYWFPRRGDKNTEISTLQGGQNLGDLADLDYFLQKLYKSLNIPTSRLEPSQGFSIGRPSEITRDEIKFQKFIKRLRRRFSMLLYDALETQLLLKNIISEDEWPEIRNNVFFEFAVDDHFIEMKNQDLLNSRIDLLDRATPYLGTFFSSEFLKKDVLQQTDEDIERIQKEMDASGDRPLINGMPQIDPLEQADRADAQREEDQDREDQQRAEDRADAKAAAKAKPDSASKAPAQKSSASLTIKVAKK
jgi:hypothetical protein